MICWGIDPGVSGAICCFDYTEGAVDIFDMPIVEVRGKKEVSPVLVRNILRDLPGPVFVERVGARPGQGVSSMFNFGKSYGMVLGVVAALDYSLITSRHSDGSVTFMSSPARTGVEQEQCSCYQHMHKSLNVDAMMVVRMLL